MEGKLIKTSIDSYHNGHYFLNDSDGFAIGSTDKDWCKRAVSKRPLYILSLKNCETIENGYDLDELAKEWFENKGCNIYSHYNTMPSFIEGFQKALELLGDKKFSEFLDREKELGISDIKTIERIQWYYNTYFDKSQQTEWDVEICCYLGNGDKESDSFKDRIVTNTGIPKLDENGCLILKRK